MSRNKASDDLELSEYRICNCCIGEDYLKQEIIISGEEDVCQYCDNLSKTWSVGMLADRLEAAYNQHYFRTAEEPDSWEEILIKTEANYDWERHGDAIIDSIAYTLDVELEVAEDVQSILQDRHSDFDDATAGIESEFAHSSHYARIKRTDDIWQIEWKKFERILKKESRYFNQQGASFLSSLFEDVESLSSKKGAPLVRTIGPDEKIYKLYRARVFQADDELLTAISYPDQHLGPPPYIFANSGRMNARGISVFYGATSEKLALSEVRPPVGSRVAVVCFGVSRPLRLLDLTAGNDAVISGSVFDINYSSQLERVAFLRNLCTLISKPIMPDDEVFSYLPTQAISDFLASDPKLLLDGIIFNSAQLPGEDVNVVLFQKSSRVQIIDMPKRTVVNATLGETYEEGFEVRYQVNEIKSDEILIDETLENDLDLFISDPFNDQPDLRIPSLTVITDDVCVHHINSVEINATKYRVKRYKS